MTTIWDKPLPYRTFDDDEPEPCRSELLLLGDRPRLRCSLDAAHLLDQFDSRHGVGLARWTDEQAADARAAWWAQFDGLCADCPRLIRKAAGTRCAKCSRGRFADDQRETTEEAA